MNSTHLAPGSLLINSGEHNGCRIDGPDGRAVAHTIQRDPHPAFGQGITQAQAEAAARLFVAAPELLEVLQTTLGNIKSLGPAGALDSVPTPYRVWADVVQAAITKATGSEG
jgi:hypothetical protein